MAIIPPQKNSNQADGMGFALGRFEQDQITVKTNQRTARITLL